MCLKSLKELKLHVANLEAILTDPELYLDRTEDVINAKMDLQAFEEASTKFANETAKYLDKRGNSVKLKSTF